MAQPTNTFHVAPFAADEFRVERRPRGYDGRYLSTGDYLVTFDNRDDAEAEVERLTALEAAGAVDVDRFFAAALELFEAPQQIVSPVERGLAAAAEFSAMVEQWERDRADAEFNSDIAELF